LAHTLAGVAGQLEAAELYDAARAVERALRAGESEGQAGLIDVLERTLNAALAAAGTLTDDAATAAVRSAAHAGTAIDPALLQLRLAELRGLLAKNSLRARKVFSVVRGSFDGAQAQDAGTLARQLEDLDFRGAEKTLATLMSGVAGAR
jgi:hypothetical protein